MTKYRLKYNHSIFWLIFFGIFCFPVAAVLLVTGWEYQKNNTTYKINYEGSRFWLGFWTLLCFPLAFILIACNGFSVESISLDS